MGATSLMTDENGESTERTRTTISMPKSRLEDFKRHAEESEEYTSLSHLLRIAGMREINGDRPAGEANAGMSEEFEEDVADLKDGMRELQQEMNDLRDLFETIEVRTREPGEDIEELQDDLFEVMPDEDQTSLAESAAGDVDVDSLLKNEYQYAKETPVPGWPEDLAEAVDATRVVDVVDAVDMMAENMGVVEKTEIAGESWYYKRV